MTSLHAFLDGEDPEDADVPRLWLLANVGKTFGVLPSQAAVALDDDPELTDLLCMTMLQYAETKAVFDRSKDPKDLEPWADSPLMSMVMQNAADRHHRKVHPNFDVDNCPKCIKHREN